MSAIKIKYGNILIDIIQQKATVNNRNCCTRHPPTPSGVTARKHTCTKQIWVAYFQMYSLLRLIFQILQFKKKLFKTVGRAWQKAHLEKVHDFCNKRLLLDYWCACFGINFKDMNWTLAPLELWYYRGITQADTVLNLFITDKMNS